MSDAGTWEWPAEMRASLEKLYEIMIPNPEPNRKITIEDLVRDDELLP